MNKMPKAEINLNAELKETLVENLQKYFWEERGEELSNFRAELLLDFIVSEIGPYIYNQAIEDSYNFMNNKIEDLFSLEKRFR